MTVVQPNSIAGINSITVQSGNALNLHKSDGTLIRTLVAESGISTYSSISVGSATTTNSADKSINIGLGASIAQHTDNSLTFGTNGDPRATIDASGRLLVGTTSSSQVWGFGQGQLQLIGDYQTGSASFIHNVNDTSNHGITLGKIRGSSIVQNGDSIGSLAWSGYDGSVYRGVARIQAAVDGSPGSNDMPGRLEFGTTPDGAGSPSERMRITSAGLVGIGTDSISGNLEIYSGASKINALTIRTGAGANGYTGLAFASNQTYSREKAAIYFQETTGGAHHAGDIVVAVDSAGGDAGQVATGDEKVRITSAGRMGIGEASPDSMLHIKANNDRSAITLENTYDNPDNVWELNPGISGVSNTGFCIRDVTDSANRLVIDGVGKVGVGTDSPDSRISIFSDSAGTVTADADADELTLENGGNVGLSLLTPGTGESSIYFGNPGTNGQKDAWIKYYHESHSTTSNRRTLSFKSGGGSEKMRMDNNGYVGINTGPGMTMTTRLQVADENPVIASFHHKGGGTNDQARISLGALSGNPPENRGVNLVAENNGAGHDFIVQTSGSHSAGPLERLRVGSNGFVGINTAIPGRYLHIVGNDGPTQATIGNSDTQLVIDNKSTNGAIIEFLSESSSAGRIFFTDPDATNQGGIEYNHSNDSFSWRVGGTKRMMLGGTEGFIYSGNQPSGEVAVSSTDDAQRGCTFNGGGTNSYHIMASNNHPTLYIARRASDGTLVTFYHDAGAEGTISVSGSTVSYNGGHLSRWSQLDGISATDKSSRPTIYQGTVMSNLDKLCEWKHSDVLYKDGDVIPDGKSIGDVREAAYTEDNQQLNMTKVSDTVGDKDVAGLFWTWDDEDDEYVNDFYIAMTGDMVIRVAGSVTVARGDLMESAGDGTAKPQSDDIIRSKTIAKIASNIATATYADGSKAYPCALMAC